MHIPVLKKEVIDWLDPQKGQHFIDGTFHMGGHAEAILERIGEKGRILGIELEKEIFKKASERYKNDKRILLINDSYANLKEIVKKNDFKNISGILLDIGISSWHVDESGKGFTFKKDEPLNMLFSEEGVSAEDIVNTYSEKDLEKIFREYGEERKSRKIARDIIEERRRGPIKSTFKLSEIIKRSVRASRTHPATRVFQALRIEANKELENLEKVLPQALDVLEKNGKIAVISFHSLEDRIVKEFSKNNKVKILTKKPIIPAGEEIIRNPRSRSAKLRVIQKI